MYTDAVCSSLKPQEHSETSRAIARGAVKISTAKVMTEESIAKDNEDHIQMAVKLQEKKVQKVLNCTDAIALAVFALSARTLDIELLIELEPKLIR